MLSFLWSFLTFILHHLLNQKWHFYLLFLEETYHQHNNSVCNAHASPTASQSRGCSLMVGISLVLKELPVGLVLLVDPVPVLFLLVPVELYLMCSSSPSPFFHRHHHYYYTIEIWWNCVKVEAFFKLVQIYNEENTEKSDIYPFWMSYNQYKVQKQNKNLEIMFSYLFA